VAIYPGSFAPLLWGMFFHSGGSPGMPAKQRALADAKCIEIKNYERR